MTRHSRNQKQEPTAEATDICVGCGAGGRRFSIRLGPICNGPHESRVGLYLESLRKSFRGKVVPDMLCYLRIQVELALRANKGERSGVRLHAEPSCAIPVHKNT